jgi:hypothetical protein
MDIILTDTAMLRPLALPARAGAAPTAALLQSAFCPGAMRSSMKTAGLLAWQSPHPQSEQKKDLT